MLLFKTCKLGSSKSLGFGCSYSILPMGIPKVFFVFLNNAFEFLYESKCR